MRIWKLLALCWGAWLGILVLAAIAGVSIDGLFLIARWTAVALVHIVLARVLHDVVKALTGIPPTRPASRQRRELDS